LKKRDYELVEEGESGSFSLYLHCTHATHEELKVRTIFMSFLFSRTAFVVTERRLVVLGGPRISFM